MKARDLGIAYYWLEPQYSVFHIHNVHIDTRLELYRPKIKFKIDLNLKKKKPQNRRRVDRQS